MFSSISTLAFGTFVFSACQQEDPVDQVMAGDNRGLGDIADSRALEHEKIEGAREGKKTDATSAETLAKISAASSERIAAIQSKAQSENLQATHDSNVAVANANKDARVHEANMQFAGMGVATGGGFLGAMSTASSNERIAKDRNRTEISVAEKQGESQSAYYKNMAEQNQLEREKLANSEAEQAREKKLRKQQSQVTNYISQARESLDEDSKPLQEKYKVYKAAKDLAEANKSGLKLSLPSDVDQSAVLTQLQRIESGGDSAASFDAEFRSVTKEYNDRASDYNKLGKLERQAANTDPEDTERLAGLWDQTTSIVNKSPQIFGRSQGSVVSSAGSSTAGATTGSNAFKIPERPQAIAVNPPAAKTSSSDDIAQDFYGLAYQGDGKADFAIGAGEATETVNSMIALKQFFSTLKSSVDEKTLNKALEDIKTQKEGDALKIVDPVQRQRFLNTLNLYESLAEYKIEGLKDAKTDEEKKAYDFSSVSYRDIATGWVNGKYKSSNSEAAAYVKTPRVQPQATVSGVLSRANQANSANTLSSDQSWYTGFNAPITAALMPGLSVASASPTGQGVSETFNKAPEAPEKSK